MASYLLLRFSSLGDVILATAAARLIKERRPGARVVLATKAGFAPVADGQPDLDEIWALGPGALMALAARIRAGRFDAVIDLHANNRSRLLGALAGAPVFRWKSHGFNRRLRVWLPMLKLEEPEPVYVRYARAAAAALGEELFDDLDLPAPLPRLGVASDSAQWADAWLLDQGLKPEQKLLAVAPGAAWATKRWGAEHLAQCLDMVSEFDKVRFLLLGSMKETALIDTVMGYMKKGRDQVIRADAETTDLRRLTALIQRCDRFLGHDSGPTHVAEALGVGVTALFGPTVRAFGFFPQGPGTKVFEKELSCRPCSVHGTERCPLRHHHCMENIEPFDVARHLRQSLGLEP